MIARSLSDLVDRVAYSRSVYLIKRACMRSWREPDAGKIILGLAVCAVTVIVGIWARPAPEPPDTRPIKERAMVSPSQIQGVFMQAESNRRRR